MPELVRPAPLLSPARRLGHVALITRLIGAAVGGCATLAPSAAAQSVSGGPGAVVAEELELQPDSATSIRGWFLPGRGVGGVLLLHGHRSSHRSMRGRARLLHRAGYPHCG